MKTLKEDWDLLEAMITTPRGYDAVQVAEMKRSFYAGAVATMGNLLAMTQEIDDPKVGGEAFKALQAEALTGFMSTIAKND